LQTNENKETISSINDAEYFNIGYSSIV